jgi:putative hemolysin
MVTTLIIIFSLVISFFFSGLEIAFISSNKLQIYVESQDDSLSGRLFSRIANRPVRFLVTLLLGNTLALVVFGVFTAKVLEESLAPFALKRIELLAIQALITTAIILVVADFIPKNLFRLNPNRFLKLFSLPYIILYYILFPFTIIVLTVAQFISEKLFKESLFRHKNTFTKLDLYGYLDEHSPDAEGQNKEAESEVQLFRNALDFPDVKVRDCMIARPDIVAVDIDEGAENLKDMFLQTGLSRILIYKGNADNAQGYVHFHNIFKKISNIQSILIPVPVIPESMPAKDALRIFMQQRKSMAVVVDEFGVTSGVLTTEDILEEIFGEIKDEHERKDLLEKQLPSGEYLFSARLEIDYLNQKYHFHLPASHDYTTLGGLILNFTGSIPKPKESIKIGEFNIKVISSSPTRIDQVQLTLKKQL